jgi:hypothetical protein
MRVRQFKINLLLFRRQLQRLIQDLNRLVIQPNPAINHAQEKIRSRVQIIFRHAPLRFRDRPAENLIPERSVKLRRAPDGNSEPRELLPNLLIAESVINQRFFIALVSILDGSGGALKFERV